MAHFAKLDSNNIVEQVVVVNNNVLLDYDQIETITNDNGQEIQIARATEKEILGINFCKNLYGEDTTWVQTSYNGNFRANYAGVGFTYDSTNDVFYAPQPYSSWSLDENYTWQPPVPYPTIEEGSTDAYSWNEDTQSWDLITD